MGAFLLSVALSSIFTSVVAAGAITIDITNAGAKGGIAALAVLTIVTDNQLWHPTTARKNRTFWKRDLIGTNRLSL
jgi:hypothetical protein